METDGQWSFFLGGVISEASNAVGRETIVAVPAHFIATDGTINEKSTPILHAIKAR